MQELPDVAAAVALCKPVKPRDYPDSHMGRTAGLRAHIQTQTDSGLPTGFAELSFYDEFVAFLDIQEGKKTQKRHVTLAIV